MSKTLQFAHEGKEYTLEYDRKSIQRMEREGFVADDIQRKPMITLPALFAGAFKKHHPFMKQKEIDTIYGLMTNKQELFDKLTDMFSDPYEALFDEPKDDEKNVQWTANF